MIVWKDIKLGEIAVSKGGSTDPRKFPKETFQLFSIPAYDAQKPEIVSGEEIGSSKKNVEPNDVLLSRIVPHIRRSWIVPSSGEHRQIASGEWMIFRSEIVAPEYLRHFLTSDPFHNRFMKTVSGVGGSLLRARPAQVYELKIPLPMKNGKPDLDEQRRIAGILDQADAIRRKRRQAHQLTDDFLRATFLDLFGDPVTNPKGWDVKLSGELFSDKPRIGTTRPAKGKGYTVVRVGELGETDIKFNKCGRVELSDDEFERFKLIAGDTVIARAIGSKKQLGKASFYTGHKEAVSIDSHVMRLRPAKGICNPIWFYLFITSQGGAQILQRAGGETAVQFNINGKQASSLKIPTPPIFKQEQIKPIWDNHLKTKERQRLATKQSDDLFASLQQRAFKGEL